MESNTMRSVEPGILEDSKKRSQFVDIWRRLCKNRLAVLGMIVLLILVFAAIFADVIAPYDYAQQDYTALH